MPASTLSPHIVTSIPGPRSTALADRLQHFESPNVTYIAEDFPIFWQSAAGCWVTDVDGNTFLDATAAFGVSALGHCHPIVTEAIQRQAATLIHGMGDVHPSAVKVSLCERISQAVGKAFGAIEPRLDAAHRTASSLWQVILGQNGSDAIEAAIKTARLATGKAGVVAFDGAYHGLSYGALNVTARPDFKNPFDGQLGSFAEHLPYGCDPSTLARTLANDRYGAVIVEPIQGRGGIRVPPEGWLAAVKRVCSDHGVLLICDEIFTGFGRTGDWFACIYEGVVPDVICLGKAIGGGLPISACVAPASIIGAWEKSRGEALHTSTFLGNPLCCAAAVASIDTIHSLNLADRARDHGRRLADQLHGLRYRRPDVIADVRGRGLMLGIQMSDARTADLIVKRALVRGLIVLPAGDGSVIEIVPPLTVSTDEADLIASLLESSLP